MNRDSAKKIYKALVRSRRFDEKVGELYTEQEIKCPVHLSLGHEGSAAGVCAALETKDKVWAGHRCHAATVSKGAAFRPLFAELYGKATGCSRGKGGSMHFVAPEVGVMGSSAVIGASIPLALGSALAAKIRKEDSVSVVFFGDGGVEQGTFHESMNFASLHKLPVIFVLENNDMSTATRLSLRQANHDLWKHAEQYKIPGFRVDGGEPQEVFNIAQKAVSSARSGGGPTLIEVMVERWAAHVLTNAGYKPVTGKKDPVSNFEKFAKEQGFLTEKEINEIKVSTENELTDALIFAKESPYPIPEELNLHV